MHQLAQSVGGVRAVEHRVAEVVERPRDVVRRRERIGTVVKRPVAVSGRTHRVALGIMA